MMTASAAASATRCTRTVTCTAMRPLLISCQGAPTSRLFRPSDRSVATTSTNGLEDDESQTEVAQRVQVTQHPAKPSTNDSSQPQQRRRRRARHDFSTVPSLQDFMQQQRVRTLYRDYCRAIQPLPSADRHALLQQIRTEFRKVPAADAWNVKRAMSEGQKRLKELQAMLGNSVVPQSKSEDQRTDVDGMEKDDNVQENEESKIEWPWQRQEEQPISKPPPIPKY